MAAFDFIVRRNVNETDTYPNAASDLLLTWDTEVGSEGSGIVYSAGTTTLGETGHFLVMASAQASSTPTNRIGGKLTITLAGAELRAGAGSFWAFRTFTDFELDLLAIGQRTRGRVDVAFVDEEVLSAIVLADEAETFLVVKELDCTCRHSLSP